MESESAITVINVSKQFRLPHEKTTTLKSHMTGFFRRSRGYEAQQALKDISFEIKKGEFFGIVGRNGSGKSTLLKILASIYQPTEGSVTVRGKLVPFIELGVGFNPELTGRENVYLNGAMLGFSSKEIDSMYDAIVGFAELEKFMDQKLKNYSSGMQVRLAFSMAIRAQADILLVDEVLAVGDADFQRKCFEYFRTLKRDKKTVVFVSHDMSAVREYCDRAIMIENSKIIATGKAEPVADKYTKLFLREQMTEREGEGGKERWGDGTLVFSRPRVEKNDQKKVVLMMDVQANRDCADPSFGFFVRNGAGETLLGSNTVLQKLKTQPLKSGMKRQIRWQFPNIFSEGDYLVTIAAQYNNGLTPGDWWEDSIKLSIKKEIHTPYRIQPDVEVEVKELSESGGK
jgi:ABC-2 type transport system ATP-binding protein